VVPLAGLYQGIIHLEPAGELHALNHRVILVLVNFGVLPEFIEGRGLLRGSGGSGLVGCMSRLDGQETHSDRQKGGAEENLVEKFDGMLKKLLK